MSRESAVSIGVVRGVVNAAEHVGISRLELLQTAGFDPELLERAEARVARSQVYRVCEQAITLSGDPAFALHWGERQAEYSFDVVAHLIAHSATLREGLESYAQFHRLLTDESSFEVSEHDGQVFICCSSVLGESLRVQRFLAEMNVTGFWKILDAFGRARPERVSFQYAAPTYCAEYTRVFEGTERFDQPFTGIVFDSALMSAPAPHNDRDMHVVLRSVAERRVLRLKQQTPYAIRVRDQIVRQGLEGRADMTTVANALGLSGRSLRRRLAGEGETYEHVASEALAMLAKQVLETTQLSLQEIAFALGFSHTSTFHRAFKRWTGMTPLAYRLQQLRDLHPGE